MGVDWIERWANPSVSQSGAQVDEFDIMRIAQDTVSSVERVLRTLCGGTRLPDPLWNSPRAMLARKHYMRTQQDWHSSTRRNAWKLDVAYWASLGHLPVTDEEVALAVGKTPGAVLSGRADDLRLALALVADRTKALVGVKGARVERATINRVGHLMAREMEGLERWCSE